MKGQKQLFSSGKDDWETPKVLFDKLNERFEFTVDAAASNENKKCEKFIPEEVDALKVGWGGEESVFCNPPYTLCPKFIKKVWEEINDEEGPHTIVLLIPARTSNKEWHKYIFGKAMELIFIEGRVKFSDAELGAPFPSVCVVYSKHHNQDVYEEPTIISTLKA